MAHERCFPREQLCSYFLCPLKNATLWAWRDNSVINAFATFAEDLRSVPSLMVGS